MVIDMPEVTYTLWTSKAGNGGDLSLWAKEFKCFRVYKSCRTMLIKVNNWQDRLWTAVM